MNVTILKLCLMSTCLKLCLMSTFEKIKKTGLVLQKPEFESKVKEKGGTNRTIL